MLKGILKKIKPKTMLLLMIAVFALQTIGNFRYGIVNLISNSAYLGFALITLFGINKKEVRKYGVIYLFVALGIKLAIELIRTINIGFEIPVQIANTILLAIQMFCLYNIVVKNNYIHNKLFGTLCLVSMLGGFSTYKMSLITSILTNILGNAVIWLYFCNYEKYYNGLLDNAVYEKEMEKPKRKYLGILDFIKTWILYVLVFESAGFAMATQWFAGMDLDGAEDMFPIVPLGMLFWILVTIFYERYKKNEAVYYATAAENQRIVNEKTAQELAYEKDSKDIYNYYIKNGYNVDDAETNTVVSGTRNIPVEQLVEMYNHGKDIVAREKEAAQAELLKEYREEDDKRMLEEKQAFALIGKEKYLSVINDRIAGVEAMETMANIMSDSYISGASLARNTRKSDPYILGGLANGIAGPGAGLMVASQVERENREREARGREVAAASLESSREWRERAYEYGRPLPTLKKFRDRINEALIVTDIEKVKDKIKITDVKYEIAKSKNFHVSITCKPEYVRILDKDAVIDGTVSVKVLDKDGNLIAEGCNGTKNIKIGNECEIEPEFGFSSSYNFIRVCCKPLDYSKVNEKEEYKVEVEFVNLWLMEKLSMDSVVHKPLNRNVKMYTSISETITDKTRLSAITKFINSVSRENLRCFAPSRYGGVVATNAYMLFRLKCDYLPCDVGFEEAYTNKAKYLEQYKEHIGELITSNYINLETFLDTTEFNDEIEIDIAAIKEKKKTKAKGENTYMKFTTDSDYEIALDYEYILTVIKILGIKENKVIGYSKDNMSPVYIFNKDQEMGLILPVKI